MARKKREAAAPVATIGGMEMPPERALKKQSCWSDSTWKPGEIPSGGSGSVGSLRSVTGVLNASRAPYGEFMRVETPTARGNGKPKEGQP